MMPNTPADALGVARRLVGTNQTAEQQWDSGNWYAPSVSPASTESGDCALGGAINGHRTSEVPALGRGRERVKQMCQTQCQWVKPSLPGYFMQPSNLSCSCIITPTLSQQRGRQNASARSCHSLCSRGEACVCPVLAVCSREDGTPPPDPVPLCAAAAPPSSPPPLVLALSRLQPCPLLLPGSNTR